MFSVRFSSPQRRMKRRRHFTSVIYFISCVSMLQEAASLAKTCSMGILILITGLPAAPEQEATGWNVFDLLVLAFTLASGCKTPSHLLALPR